MQDIKSKLSSFIDESTKAARFAVTTREDNDGYEADHVYVFDNKDELIRFLLGEFATDHYGERISMNYYEIITEITLEADIDITELYELRNEETSCE